MKAFDASDRLFKQAAAGETQGNSSRFQAAAVRYAASLRLLSEGNDQGGGRDVQARRGTADAAVVPAAGAEGSPRLGTTERLPVTTRAPQGVEIGDAPPIGVGVTGGARDDTRVTVGIRDAAGIGQAGDGLMAEAASRVAILNHAVKDALDSMQLKEMVRELGCADTPAGRAMLTHAREMDTESLQAVERVLSSTSDGDGPRNGAAGPGLGEDAIARREPLRTLALQATEVVMAIEELTRGPRPAGHEK